MDRGVEERKEREMERWMEEWMEKDGGTEGWLEGGMEGGMERDEGGSRSSGEGERALPDPSPAWR